MTDHRSIPGAHLARIGKLLDKIRLDNNNVGDLAVFDPFFYGGSRPRRRKRDIGAVASRGDRM